MSENTVPPWLQWAREIQSLSQTGLTYSESDYATKRYQRLTELAAEMVAAHTSLSGERLFKTFLEQPGYATPKVDVRGAVLRDGKLLLVQERADQLWCMPGGWAEVGGTPSETVVREVWEESGLEVVVRKLIGVYDGNRSGTPLEFFHAYKIVFLCEITGGRPQASDETLAVDFFAFDQLPELSSQRTHARHLQEVREHLQDPARAAQFD